MYRAFLGGVLFCCLLMSVNLYTVYASEGVDFEGENQFLDDLMYMDEQTNIAKNLEGFIEEVRVVNSKLKSSGSLRIVNLNTKPSTETTKYVGVGTGIEGYLCGDYGADAVYLGEENGKVKFLISGVVGLVNPSDVEVVSVDKTKSISYYKVVKGNLIHRVTTNIYSSVYNSNLNNGPAPEYLSEGVKYYSYDGHYFYKDLGVLVSDYKLGIRNNSVNNSKPFYNYFQYLPFRSTSSYSADELTEFINSKVSNTSKIRNIGGYLINSQNTYGTNALLLAGISANESAWGMSNICQTKNNIFGINAVDSSPGQSAYYFPDVASCIREYSERMLSRQYFNPDNWKYFGAFLGNKASGVNVKYASDPYWGEKAAAIAWSLDEMGGCRDRYLYTLGVKDIGSYTFTDLNVRVEATTSSKSVYTTGVQPEHMFIILDKIPVNNFYKVQSDPVLNEGRGSINTGVGQYDSSKMYLYSSSKYINIVSESRNGNFSDVGITDWYYGSVEFLKSKGIMTGLNPGIFGPIDEMSRAQFVTVLYRMHGSPKVEYKNRFKDVPNGMWYSDAVIWAVDGCLVTGYTEDTFGTFDGITREQMMIILYRYACGMHYETGNKVSINNFLDYSSISEYARESVAWAVGNGLVTGKSDGQIIDPQSSVLRAEGATVIHRLLNNIVKSQS